MTIKIQDFGNNITNEIIGEQIYLKIKENLSSDEIELDFQKVRVMTTFCAKQIFGRLLKELGQEMFFRKLSFVRADDNIKYIISIGVE